MLMLPGGRVHLTSGILPRKALALADDWTRRGLQRIVPSVRVGPVLIDPGDVRLPKVHVLGEAQSLIRRTGPLTWREDPIVSATSAALLPRLARKPLPVRALILSAGKSIHAWVDVDCADAAEWEREVNGVLFPKFLVPLGCDPSCRNRSRLSRMPGYTRPADSKSPGGMQRLIWLSPEGKAVCE